MPPKHSKPLLEPHVFLLKPPLQIHFKKRDGSGSFQSEPKRKTQVLTLYIGTKLS